MTSLKDRLLSVFNNEKLTQTEKSSRITDILDDYKGSYAVEGYLLVMSILQKEKQVPIQKALGFVYPSLIRKRIKEIVSEVNKEISLLQAYGYVFPWERSYWKGQK